MFDTKKQVKSIIFRAEVFAQKSGVSVMDILETYAQELKKDKKEIAKILLLLTGKLKQGEKRWNVYKKYVDKDILDFLKIADSKNIPAGTIFQEYAPIKEEAEKYISGIRRKLFSPLVLTLVLMMAMGISIGKFKIVRGTGIIHFSNTANFCMDYFYHVNIAIVAIMFFLFVVIPHKMPLLRNIFIKLYSMLGLSMILMMVKLGYSSSEIILPFKRQFNIRTKRAVSKDINGLLKLLKISHFINHFESANLKLSLNHANLENGIEEILRNRKDEAASLNEEIGSILKNITLLMVASPLLMTVIVMLNLMIGASQAVH